MGAGAIGEQTQLLLLDAVLHLATSTVDLVVELLGIAVEIGDDKAGLRPYVVTSSLAITARRRPPTTWYYSAG